MSKTVFARIALGLVALTGVVAAGTASAHPWEGYRGRGYERVVIERPYPPVAYGYGYGYGDRFEPRGEYFWHHHRHFHYYERGRW